MKKEWRKVRNIDRRGKIDRNDLESSVKTYHVLPDDGNWSVRKAGASRATRRFSTQHAAVEHAREAARKIGRGEVIIHGKDGRIRRKDSYGEDPIANE